MQTLIDHIEVTSRFGRYLILQISLCFIVVLSTACQNLAIVFTGQVPKFRCDNSSDDSQLTNLTNVCLPDGKCPHPIFLEEMQTVVTKYNLVCDRSFLLPLISTLYMIGFFFGAPAYGYVSDRFGRLRGLILCGVQTMVCALATALAPNYIMYVIFNMVKAFGASGVYVVTITYALECSSSNMNRAATVHVTVMPWSIAYFVLSGAFYALQNQTHLELLLSFLYLSTIATYFLCQESPKWLLATGKVEKAKEVVKRIVKINRMTLDANLEEVETWVKPVEKKHSESVIKGFLLNATLRQVVCSVCFFYFTGALMYYGFVYGSSNLTGLSVLQQTLIVASLELFEKIVLIPVTQRAERLHITIASIFLVAILTLIVAGLIGNKDLALPVAIFCLFPRVIVSYFFIALTLFSVEVFPTTHRNFGVGSANAAARIGGIFASQMTTLGHLWPPAPFILYGVCSVVVVLLKLFLPETRYRPCPETMAEMEQLMKDFRFISRLRRRLAKEDVNMPPSQAADMEHE